MSTRYESVANAILEKASQDTRIQPWRSSVDTTLQAPSEEWVKVAPSHARPAVDVRENAFPMGAVDVRTNAFPMGEVDVRTNAFPIDARTNAFPMGDVNMMTNSFPI